MFRPVLVELDPEKIATSLLKFAKDWEMALQFLDTYYYNELGIQLDTTKIEQIIRNELREEYIIMNWAPN